VIEAIPTVYRGIKFRSRIEARWAAFFDAIRIRWEYEPQGYAINGINYLPDFWLPDVHSRGIPGGLFFEVKGIAPTPDEQRKASSLALACDRTVIVAASGPKEPEFEQLNEFVNGSRGVWDDDGLMFARCEACASVNIDHYARSCSPCPCGGSFSSLDTGLMSARAGFNELVRWMAA